MKTWWMLLGSGLLLAGTALPAAAAPIPAGFDAVGADRQAIQALLDTYTKAVSTKDERLFETILLNRNIPFSSAGQAIGNAGKDGGSSNYEDFRKGVFGGAPFTQTFRDVHISQDGPLADVSLVFVNKAADGDSWGWKTLQLLKVAGTWKIASEFYTGHAMG